MKMLKANMIHFLGTDSHRHQTVYLEAKDAIEIVDKVAGKQKRVELTEINPSAILENKKIEIEEPLEIKKSFGEKLKSIFKK